MSTIKDILIYETGSGGDIAIINGDIALGDSLYQQVYIALFGGNVEADTLGNELPSQIRDDWWGNSSLFSASGPSQFNSQTERAIMSNVLDSKGRVKIQRAVEADLAHLSNIAIITVTVSVPGPKNLQILIDLKQPGDKQNVQLQVLWDNAKNEVIINEII